MDHESAWNQWQILQKTCNAQNVPGSLCRNIFVFHAHAHKFSLGPYLVFEFVTLYLKTNFCSPPLFFCSVSLMLFFFSLLCLKRGLETNYFLRASVSVTSIDQRDRGKSWPKRVALDDMAPTRDCQFFQGDSLNQDFSFLRAFCLLKGKLRWPINGNWNPVFP